MNNQQVLISWLMGLTWASLALAQISTVTQSPSCPLQQLVSPLDILQAKTTAVRPASPTSHSEIARIVQSLASTTNIRLRSDDATVLGEPGKRVIILDLINMHRQTDRLFMYYIESTQDIVLMHITLNEKEKVELRLWAGGDKELLITEEKAVYQSLSPELESAVFSIRAQNIDHRLMTVSDALSCIAQALGISIDASSIFNLLSSVSCSAKDAWSLYKTAAHCISAFSVGTATAVSTAFCVTGIGIDIGCNLLSCRNTPSSPSHCVHNIGTNMSVQGTWTSDCPSQSRRGSYAKYYTFTISQTNQVRINLRSPGVDNYLYLFSGSSATGTPIASDDDSLGNLQASIQRTLNAGTYTIEATTYGSGVTGTFLLELMATATPSTGPSVPPSGTGCLQTISVNTSLSGEFTPDCMSYNRSGHYAKYYVFTLTERASVQIDLVSDSVDTFLFLVDGGTGQGRVIALDDDGGEGFNSRLVQTLNPGTYTVECTTYVPRTTGPFRVTLTRR